MKRGCVMGMAAGAFMAAIVLALLFDDDDGEGDVGPT